MESVSYEELPRLLHPTITNPERWKVARYEVELDLDTSLPSSITIELFSTSNEVKRLRFDEPQLAEFGPFQIPQITSIYIANTSSLGWESSRSIEVGGWFEDRDVLFWAAGVTEIA